MFNFETIVLENSSKNSQITLNKEYTLKFNKDDDDANIRDILN